ncbi:hypothetical protein EMIT0P44_180008 [Pseudomonas sp. IT-P44]
MDLIAGTVGSAIYATACDPICSNSSRCFALGISLNRSNNILSNDWADGLKVCENVRFATHVCPHFASRHWQYSFAKSVDSFSLEAIRPLCPHLHSTRIVSLPRAANSHYIATICSGNLLAMHWM